MDAPLVIALEPRHLEAAVALLEAQLAEHEMAQPADVLRAVTKSVLSDSRHGFMLLALAGDRPVGIAYAAAHLSAEHGGTIGWLEELYVLPEWRARGVGSALLKAVMAHAHDRQWRGLELEVVAGHERALPLYARHGFRALPRTRFSRIFHD